MRNRGISPVLIVTMTVFSLAVYNWLPAEIDSHWNAAGQADDTMGRTVAVILTPAIALGIWLLLKILPRIDPKHESYDRFQGTYWLILNAIVLFLAAIHILILANGLGWEVSVARVVMVGVGLLFTVLGNELGRVRPNWFMGIRTPWTLSDPEVWRDTHRLGGRLFVVTGLAIVLGGLVLPLAIASYALPMAVVGVAIILGAYSYLIWRQKHAGSS